MSENIEQTQTQNQLSDKEINFRKQEQMYQRILQEKEARIADLERLSKQQVKEPVHYEEEEDETDDPYVDHKRMKKNLAKAQQNTQSEIIKAMEAAKLSAKEELRQELWLENHPDFFDVIEKSDVLAEKSPKLADTILKMPKNFETQKLVYHTMKELGLHGEKQKNSNIQDRINANMQNPGYAPSSVGSSPYNMMGGDFSDKGQEAAYKKLQELKARISG